MDVDCVIKLGGSAVTEKHEFETVKLQEIESAAIMIRRLIENGKRCIIVHGAGSFGHHQAKKYNLHNGLKRGVDVNRKGFCVTRCSVTKLNKIIVDAFVEANIPAVSQSPCGPWITDNGAVVKDGVDSLTTLLSAGFIPIIHGDCVLDQSKGCTILSGDTVIKVICEKMTVSRVIFLTDVAGVYTHPPGHVDSQLIPKIVINRDGSSDLDVLSDQHHYDVTGGISFKLSTAVDVVVATNGRTKVFICRINSDAALESCLSGELDSKEGTLVDLNIE